MLPSDLLHEIKTVLQNAYGSRLQGLVLYGSEARGDAGPDSDIDIMVLLDSPAKTWADIHAANVALYPLIQRLGRIIDAMPIDIKRYRTGQAPLYEAARREGVLL